MTPPTHPVRRIFVLILGWVLILLGIVGLFTPFLQGILFIVAGLYVLSRESRWARSLVVRFRQRYPMVDEKARALIARLRRDRGTRVSEQRRTTVAEQQSSDP